MPDFQLTTPVALIIFNRPDTTARVFAEIAKARPRTLLLIGDGPRPAHAGEAELVAQTRAIVRQIDWPCDVLTNYSDANLGCQQRVVSGISWVFEQVGEAIILEDDCLPESSFFDFCQQILERYRHDLRISMVSGDNFQYGRKFGEDSYYFSKYGHIWGWATWRDRWTGAFDIDMRHWPQIRDTHRVADLVLDEAEAGYWRKALEHVYRERSRNVWDYQWSFANWLQGRLCILPAVNLVSNIGFGADATNTGTASQVANMATEPMHFPLIHPAGVIRNSAADRFTCERCFQPPLWKRALQRITGPMRRMIN
jgi:hypothetical protein